MTAFVTDGTTTSDSGMEEEERRMLEEKLEQLRSEHRDLDDVIRQITENAPYDQIQVRRLKKRKLILKDQIITLENKLLPDIIA